MKWGMNVNGNLLIANILFHKTGIESSLSDILEDQVQEKYYLSETSVKSMIEHAKRHKEKGNGFGVNILEQSMPTIIKEEEAEP
jgi:hypothetical protein